jgi:LPXTG-motif cell wall-anchored protein
MNHNHFSSRARARCMFSAGVAALVGTLWVSGAAGATSDPPRFTIESAVDCAGPSITLSYDDHVDGHVPKAVHETFEDVAQIVWSADEVHQVNGDYFNQRTFPMAGTTVTVYGSYIYTVEITYDDGVLQGQSVFVEMSEVCGDSPSTTTAPQNPLPTTVQNPPATTVPPQNPPATTMPVLGGSLPETGAADMTWIIGAIGGMLLTTGSALFAGARRSRSH